jgi:predicted small lipoprotein YifL
MRTVLTALLLTTFLLSGCGQKGPLTLPQDDAAGSEQ